MSDKFSISAVLEHYGAPPMPGRTGWNKLRCVVHDERNASASFNEQKGSFRCFACDIFGDAIDLVMLKEGGDYASAKARCEEITGETVSDGGFGPPTKQARRLPTRLTDDPDDQVAATAATPPPTVKRRARRLNL